MDQVSNFLFVSRLNNNSFFERIGDYLLTPARTLFGGRSVVVLTDGSMHISYQIKVKSWLATLMKILKVILVPLSFLGAIIKLVSLTDKDYRDFCAKRIPESSNCDPKLYEMFQHVHATKNFVTVQNNEHFFKPLGLSECLCSNNGAFNRFTSSRRNNLENATVKKLCEIHPDKNQQISLLSMGSGGLMCDFLLLEKLVLAGFKKISIDCVDPKGIKPEQMEKIREFFGKYPQVSIEINGYSSIDMLPNQKRNYAAVVAIDYALWYPVSRVARVGLVDLLKAKNRLSENGFTALGDLDSDILTGKNMAPLVLTPDCYIHSMASDLVEQLRVKKVAAPAESGWLGANLFGKPKTELRIVIPEIGFAFGMDHLFLYALSSAMEQSAKSYGKVSVVTLSKTKDKGDVESYKEMLQALFPKTDVSVAVHKPNERYDLLLTEENEPTFTSKEYENLLDVNASGYVISGRGRISRLRRSGETVQVYKGSK